jgi:hypothetical protein
MHDSNPVAFILTNTTYVILKSQDSLAYERTRGLTLNQRMGTFKYTLVVRLALNFILSLAIRYE